MLRILITTVAVLVYAPASSDSTARLTSSADVLADITDTYLQVEPDITYATANNYDSKLDIYRNRSKGKKPTLVFFHGGGWMGGFSKTSFSLVFVPFLQLGWNIVNVDYRPSSVSLAPAAVQDCLCALRWIALHADQYDIDLTAIVLMGNSAGGHLALMAGMVSPAPSSNLSGPCGSSNSDSYSLTMTPTPTVRPAAIVNLFGITDVVELYRGPNLKAYAALWIGGQPDGESVARLVSPLSHVREGLPPIITVHGDQDTTVPYSQATRLHAALDAHGVKNKLVTITGGGHSAFGKEGTRFAFKQIFDFLESVGLPIHPENEF